MHFVFTNNIFISSLSSQILYRRNEILLKDQNTRFRPNFICTQFVEILFTCLKTIHDYTSFLFFVFYFEMRKKSYFVFIFQVLIGIWCATVYFYFQVLKRLNECNRLAETIKNLYEQSKMPFKRILLYCCQARKR